MKSSREFIMVRWWSIRDRYKKTYHEELNRPSGSGETRRQTYRYSAALGFLRRMKILGHRNLLGNSRSQSRSLMSRPPRVPLFLLKQLVRNYLIVPSGDSTMATIAPLFEALIHRQRSSRSRQADYEDLTRLVYKTMCGQTNRIAALEAMVRNLREVVVQITTNGPLNAYWLTLNPLVEDFMPDQVFEVTPFPIPQPKLPFPQPKLPFSTFQPPLSIPKPSSPIITTALHLLRTTMLLLLSPLLLLWLGQLPFPFPPSRLHTPSVSLASSQHSLSTLTQPQSRDGPRHGLPSTPQPTSPQDSFQQLLKFFKFQKFYFLKFYIFIF